MTKADMVLRHNAEVRRQGMDKKTMASRLIKQASPEQLSVMSKLIANNERPAYGEKDRKEEIGRNIFDSLYERLRTSKRNHEQICQLFPDIEMAIQIWVSAILSPKKLTDTQLIYAFKEELTLPPNVSSAILDTVKKHIIKHYTVEDRLASIVKEAMFTSGAYILAYIPEASLDAVINGDLLASLSKENFNLHLRGLNERLSESYGFIGKLPKSEPVTLNDKSTYADIARHMVDNYISVTDNREILQLPRVVDKIRTSINKKSFRGGRLSSESIEKLEYLEVFRKRDSRELDRNAPSFVTVNTRNENVRKSIGKPLELKLSRSSTIPIYTAGDEQKHKGYIVLLDENCMPLGEQVDRQTLDTMSNTYNMDFTGTSAINPPYKTAEAQNQRVYRELFSSSLQGFDPTKLLQTHRVILEDRLNKIVREHDGSIKVSDRDDLFNLMFARALADQKTTMLYIPAELVCYYAFNFNEYGIGKSMLENINILISMRAVLLFATVNRQIKESIDNVTVKLTLDEDELDPRKTIAEVTKHVLDLRQNSFPFGSTLDPNDISDMLVKSGLNLVTSGCPGMPATTLEYENTQLNHVAPADELSERLKRDTCLALLLQPETVDGSLNDPERAASVVSNNVMLAKRVLSFQKQLTSVLSKHHGILIQNDENLRDEIRKTVEASVNELGSSLTEHEKELYRTDKDRFFDYYIEKIADNVSIDLPKPDNTNVFNLSAEFELHSANLEAALTSIFSEEILGEDENGIGGSLVGRAKEIHNNLKHHFLREWMANNNYYPEVLKFCNGDKEAQDGVIKQIESHLASVMRGASIIVQRSDTLTQAVNNDLKGLANGGDGGYGEPSGSSEPPTESGGGEEDSGTEEDDDYNNTLGI